MSQDVVTRLRAQSGTTAQDVVTRLRVRAGATKDVVTRLRARNTSALTVSIAGTWRATVNPFDTIDLTISASLPPDAVSITQTSGPAVVIGGSGVNRTMVAPARYSGATITLLVSATKAGYATATRSYTVAVRPHGGLYGQDGTALRSAGLMPTGIWPQASALIGINVQTRLPLTYDQTIAQHEAMIGRPADLVHNYHWIGTAFPNAMEAARTRAGQIVITSIQSQNGSGIISWASIAAGGSDAAIDAYAAGVKSLAPNPVIVNFENEPELNLGTVGSTSTDGKPAKGSAADYIAAYQRLVTRFRAAGVTNAIFAPIFAGINTTNKRNQVLSMWPGADYVDAVGWDPYTRVSDSGGLKSFADTISPWYIWATTTLPGASTLPFFLGEYGAEENPADPQWKGQWFREAADAISARTYPQLKALCYFDHFSDGSGVWDLRSSEASQAGYQILANRLLGGRTDAGQTYTVPTYAATYTDTY